MVSVSPLLLSVVAGICAIALPNLYKQWAAQKAAGPLERYPVVQVTPEVYKLPILWKQLGGLLNVEVAAFLIKGAGSEYILVDTGVPGDEHEQAMLASIGNATKDGQLKLIILTHGHIDHVGSLPAILKAHPDVQVVMHEAEAPFLTGTAHYKDVPSDTRAYRLLRGLFPHFNTTAILPPPQYLLLSGETGDVADAKGPNGEAARWLPQKGSIKFYRTPGHSPGLVAYLHSASRTLIIGDTLATQPGGRGAPRTLGFPPIFFTSNNTQIKLDAQKLASLDFERGLPSHQFDHGPPISKAEAQAFAKALAA